MGNTEIIDEETAVAELLNVIDSRIKRRETEMRQFDKEGFDNSARAEQMLIGELRDVKTELEQAARNLLHNQARAIKKDLEKSRIFDLSKCDNIGCRTDLEQRWEQFWNRK